MRQDQERQSGQRQQQPAARDRRTPAVCTTRAGQWRRENRRQKHEVDEADLHHAERQRRPDQDEIDEGEGADEGEQDAEADAEAAREAGSRRW